MDYSQAEDIIEKVVEHYQRQDRLVTIKKLKNATWLKRETEPATDEFMHFYTLELFGKKIIEYHKEYLRINDFGFFSRTTHDRFNEFLPRGFRVSGYTPMFLRRPVGFVRTNIGNFPYNMPMCFQYDGTLLDEDMKPSGLVALVELTKAGDTLQKIPAYVDAYLDRLLGDERTWDVPGKALAVDYFRWSDEEVRVNVAKAINWNLHFAYLATCLRTVAGGLPDPLVDGMDNEDVLEILVEGGHRPFKQVRSNDDEAHRLEALLFHQKRIVPTPYGGLRKKLRIMLIDALVRAMGFEHVEWNRR